jgi:hypothetical protein
VFHLALLAPSFTQSFSVAEGHEASLSVTHDSTSISLFDEDLLFYLSTLDRNAPSTRQTFIRRLFGLPRPYTTNAYPDTYVERTGLAGRATARSQYYGR